MIWAVVGVAVMMEAAGAITTKADREARTFRPFIYLATQSLRQSVPIAVMEDMRTYRSTSGRLHIFIYLSRISKRNELELRYRNLIVPFCEMYGSSRYSHCIYDFRSTFQRSHWYGMVVVGGKNLTLTILLLSRISFQEIPEVQTPVLN